MQNSTILDAIEPKVIDALTEQADDIAHGKQPNEYVKAAIALGSVPVMLGALATMAPAQMTSPAVDVLQFALLLENLENQFYLGVTGAAGSPFAAAFATVRGKFAATNAGIVPTLNLLSQHETAHVKLLQTTISKVGGTPRTYDPASTFDFTGSRKQGGDPNGPFYGATQDVAFLLAATQGFEDTGVRAYKGQAGVLLGNPYLTPALQIHALEARHAARIRRLRLLIATAANPGLSYAGTVKGADAAAAGPGTLTPPPAVVAAFNAIYAGEGNTTHVVNNGSTDVTINVATLPNLAGGTDVTAGFDEPLGAKAVAAIVQPFVIPDVMPLLGPGLSA